MHGPASGTLAAWLARAEPTRRRWRCWGSWEPALAGTTFHAVRHELHDRNASFEGKDEILAALVRIAQRHDTDAVGVVVALLLPGLQRRARRPHHCGGEDAFSEVLAAVCGHILRYDTARHPSHVASNLLQRSTRDLNRAVAQARAHAGHVCSLEAAGEIAEPRTVTEVALDSRLLLGSVADTGTDSRSDVALLYTIDFIGVPLRDVARALGIGYEAAKKRRQRARRRLRTRWRGDQEPT